MYGNLFGDGTSLCVSLVLVVPRIASGYPFQGRSRACKSGRRATAFAASTAPSVRHRKTEYRDQGVK